MPTIKMKFTPERVEPAEERFWVYRYGPSDMSGLRDDVWAMTRSELAKLRDRIDEMLAIPADSPNPEVTEE